VGVRLRGDAASRPTARHGRQHRGSIGRTIVGFIAAALAVVLVSGLSVAAFAVNQVTDTVAKNTVHLAGGSAPPNIDALQGGVNLLLVGTDTRTGQAGFDSKSGLADSSGAGNNDVNMLLHIASDHQSALLVSFPRDLMIPIPSCPDPDGGSYGAVSVGMLNTTLSRGGLNCPVLTIEKLTGVDIPYAASISFDGVIAMSDAIGGVTVCVATAIDDTDSGTNLTAGEHTLTGNDALAFLRTRHGVADGSDLGRISNQQVFLSALARKVKSEGTLTDPLKLYSLAKAAVTNMTLSDTLARVDTMVQIALTLKNIPLSNIAMIQYPAASSDLYPNRVVVGYGYQAVNSVLQQDSAVQVTGGTGRGAQLATPAPTTSASPPTGDSATPAPSGTATGPVQLPTSVQGQSADQQTCSKGNG
jgi:LCP family protein required for cell wall assembly